MMLVYKDIEDRTKVRRTFGKPIGVRHDGPLNAWGLVVQCKRSQLFIPHYLLEGASKAYFNDFKARDVYVQ